MTSCGAQTRTNGGNDEPFVADGVSTISATSSMISPRSAHTATRLPDGQVLIAGGMERNGVIFGSAELYNPATGRFTVAAKSMNKQRVGHTATLLSNGKVLVAGGENDHALASAEIYDSATGKFTLTGNLKAERTMHTAVLLAAAKY
ncbi:MAG: kelch repeat-containing protein [Pyrinomonadaceae bacterium]